MRCFIAAWPDDAGRERTAGLIGRLAERYSASRAIAPANIHLTLAFIGTLDDARAEKLAVACHQFGAHGLDWQLDTLVHFKRAQVLAATGPAQPRLLAAAAAVRTLLADLAIDYDRKPLMPHVTLLRKCTGFDAQSLIDPPIAWTVDHIALYRSKTTARGSEYERVG